MKKVWSGILLLALAFTLFSCTTPPIVDSFTVTPASLPIGGGTVTLAWGVRGSDSNTIDQGIGEVTGSSKTVTVTTNTTFKFSAKNPAGLTEKTASVTVAEKTADTSKPTISSFTVTPATLPAGGGEVTFAWAATGADSLSIDQGVGTVTGTSKVVSVTATKTFTLTATNANGSVTSQAQVAVSTVTLDTIPPTILSVSPEKGAQGVREDAVIVINFSESMNRLVSENAYSSSSLGITRDGVTFQWSDNGRSLTIKPSSKLVYNASFLSARSYEFMIRNVATDLAGNSLSNFSSSFSTFRVYSSDLPPIVGLSGNVREDGHIDNMRPCVGDPSNITDKGFFSFDLAEIPNNSIIETAELGIYQRFLGDDPYGSGNLGDVNLESVSFNSLNLDAYNIAALVAHGSISSDPSLNFKTKNVSDSLRADYENRISRGNKSQFRLSFFAPHGEPGTDPFACFRKAGTDDDGPPSYLRVGYLAP